MDHSAVAAFDTFSREHVIGSDAFLDAAVAATEAAGMPAIQVDPPLGKFLHLVARMVRSRRILEIGALGGYSTIWLARALPTDGKLISLEISARHAEVALSSVGAAGLGGLVEFRVAPALETLSNMVASGEEAFDMVFIDADKANVPNYFELAMKLTHPGSAIVVDNVVREGAVANPDADDPDCVGLRKFLVGLRADKRVTGTVIQTVGSKEHDGFALLLVQ